MLLRPTSTSCLPWTRCRSRSVARASTAIRAGFPRPGNISLSILSSVMPEQQPPQPFASFSRTAESHFDLWYYAAVLAVIAQASRAGGSGKAVFEQFPFLTGYAAEIAG